jgi:hypothetical protein
MIPNLPTYVLLVTKTLSLIGISVYAVFAGILVRQEQLMAHVLEESFEPVLRALALIHFLATITVLVLAFVLL